MLRWSRHHNKYAVQRFSSFLILHKHSCSFSLFHYILNLSPIRPAASHSICPPGAPTSSPLVRSVWGTAKWSGTCTGSSCHLVPVRSCRPNHKDKITPYNHGNTPSQNAEPTCVVVCSIFSCVANCVVHHELDVKTKCLLVVITVQQWL